MEKLGSNNKCDFNNEYIVEWNELGNSSRDSMPLGNGSVGINLWTEQNGTVVFYIASSDALDEYCRIIKLGKVIISFNKDILCGGNFIQRLDMKNGNIIIKNDTALITVWISEGLNNIFVDIKSNVPVKAFAKAELWRLSEYEYAAQVGDVYKNLTGEDPRKTIVSPDTILKTNDNTISWLHYNKFSTYKFVMEHQGLGEIADKYDDMLFHRASGCIMSGDDFVKTDDLSLESNHEKNHHLLKVTALVSPDTDTESWYKCISAIHESETCSLEKTAAYWNAIWKQSYIHLSGNDKCSELNRAYIMQRFMNLASGRGNLPIKFNGSIFTVDFNGDPDYRRWGAGIWFQNTRLCIWPMLASGDYDVVMPFINVYTNALELLKDRNHIYYNHPGIHNTETIYPWGVHVNGHYGWNREGKTPDYVECPFISYYWQSGIELIEMMLQYFSCTGDTTFAEDKLLPYAREIIKFYMYHYKKDKDGKLIMTPASSLETWHKVVNPTPEITGLTSVINKLMSLDIADAKLKVNCMSVLNSLPDLPVGTTEEGKKVILPGKEYSDCRNIENPELYTVFPYRQFGIGKDDIELAQNTFDARRIKKHCCWHQDDIQAAFLGRAKETFDYLYDRTKGTDEHSKFPGFWAQYNDWVPDMDHGGVFMTALQSALIQTNSETNKIYVLPALPKNIDVDFRLFTDNQTIIECSYKNGSIEKITTYPEYRKDDVIIMVSDQTWE